jgi:hypothetical protein
MVIISARRRAHMLTGVERTGSYLVADLLRGFEL